MVGIVKKNRKLHKVTLRKYNGQGAQLALGEWEFKGDFIQSWVFFRVYLFFSNTLEKQYCNEQSSGD